MFRRNPLQQSLKFLPTTLQLFGSVFSLSRSFLRSSHSEKLMLICLQMMKDITHISKS